MLTYAAAAAAAENGRRVVFLCRVAVKPLMAPLTLSSNFYLQFLYYRQQQRWHTVPDGKGTLFFINPFLLSHPLLSPVLFTDGGAHRNTLKTALFMPTLKEPLDPGLSRSADTDS
jgi:hypothetical protein